MYIYIYTYIYIYIYIYIYTYISIYIYIYLYISIYIYLYLSISIYLSIYIYTYLYIDTHRYNYIFSYQDHCVHSQQRRAVVCPRHEIVDAPLGRAVHLRYRAGRVKGYPCGFWHRRRHCWAMRRRLNSRGEW